MTRTRARRGALVCALLAALLATVGLSPTPSEAQTAAEQADEDDLWCWTNRDRIERGLAPLPMGRLLRDDVARPWSGTIASRGRLEHRGNLWSATSTAVAGADAAGENIAYSWSGSSIRSMYDAWMRSSSHRANILSSRWEYIGVGVTHTGSHRWGVQDFASTNRTDVTPIYPAGQEFIDVCDNSAFFADIGWMGAQGVSTGTVHPRFRLFKPMRTTTRAAMAAFLWRAVDPGTSTAPPTCSTSPYPYPDAASSPFRNEICWMYEQGINAGPGGFQPNQAVSRARLADWLFKAADRDCDPGEVAPQDCYQPPPTPTFRDVPTGSAYYDAIEWAAAAGITNGYSNGTFRPSNSITRQAIAAMLHRYVD